MNKMKLMLLDLTLITVLLMALTLTLNIQHNHGVSATSTTAIYSNQNFNHNDKIIFAQSGPTTGDTKFLGIELNLGLLAAFNEINRLGGVWGGKTLELVMLDDGYEPQRTVNNTKRFLDEIPDLFGFIGYVGTAGGLATLELLSDYPPIPFIDPMAGALTISSQFNEKLIRLRSSYDDEAAAIVKYLVESRLITEISLLFQDDSFGYSGRDAFLRVMTPLGLQFKSQGNYTRNMVDVEQAVIDIAHGKPKAIGMCCGALTFQFSCFLAYFLTKIDEHKDDRWILTSCLVPTETMHSKQSMYSCSNGWLGGSTDEIYNPGEKFSTLSRD